MSNNDLWCSECKSHHHPMDCPLDREEEKVEGITIEFKYKANYPNQPETNVSLVTTGETLNEIIPAFEQFLRGCGFVFDGQIDIVENEDEEE